MWYAYAEESLSELLHHTQKDQSTLKLKELKNKFTSELTGIYPSEEVQSFFVILSEFILKYTRFQITLNSDVTISDSNLRFFEKAIFRLKRSEPIQYITGETEFYRLPFKVNKYTLIPRPETEELVDWIVSDVKMKSSDFSILDMGTGSGCIAISLAKSLENARISALDLSTDALEMAWKNSNLNQVRVDFFEMDILSAQELPQSYNLIVSNPPYVRELEKEHMKANVLEHEPEAALFVGDAEPLLFYRKIAVLAKQHLISEGGLYFEINEYLGNELARMLELEGFSDIEIRKDIFGKDRMLRCYLTEDKHGTT